MITDDSHSAPSLVSTKGIRTVPNENLSAVSESTVLYVNEYYHESSQLFD